MALTIFYDGECPFCSRYVRLMRLKEASGGVRLIDVRADEIERRRLEAEGFNLDKGMVLLQDGHLYGGAEAVNRIALMSTASSAFNRANKQLLGNPIASRILYPLLRAGRNATLLVLDRPPIGPSDETQKAFFSLFSMMWGIFSFLHFLVYAYQFGEPIYATTMATPVLGALLIFYPASRRLFLLLLVVMSADAWLHLPVYSNHTMIKNVALLAMLSTGIWHWVRGGKWESFVADFAAVGRTLLLTMYFFGVFHKLNSGFLDPAVSCAVVLWRQMPFPLSALDNAAIHYLAIYGALAVELIVMIALIVPRFRHYGILLGVAFHMLLALSGYAMYAPFSMLCISLHCLFLSPQASQRIMQSGIWKRMTTGMRSRRGLVIFAIWGSLIFFLAWLGSYSSQALVWLLGLVPLWYVIAICGNDTATDQAGNRSLFWAKWAPLNLLSVMFFLSCLAPYLGLKTAQSMNMFANLRLEGSVSNHYILPNRPGPFRYLEDLVTIEKAENAPYLSYLHVQQLDAVYYDLLDTLERSPGARVTFTRNGSRHTDQTAATLRTEIENTLHPRWVRNWFHFTPVDLTMPKPCALDR